MTSVHSDEPSDVISDQCLEASNAHGEELLNSLLDSFDDMEEDGLDPLAVVFHLWVSFIYLLMQSGWTEKDLQENLTHHANNQDVEGHA